MIDDISAVAAVQSRETKLVACVDHHRKVLFLVVAGPFDASEEIPGIAGIFELLPAAIDSADRRPIVAQFIICLEDR